MTCMGHNCLRCVRCRFLSELRDWTLAKMQLTSFGKRARKKTFFEETPSTEYGRVVEALWAQETQRGRKEFHIWAQCQWKEVYAVSSAARKELLKQHHFDDGGSDVSGSGRSGFFSRLPDAARSGSAEGPPAKHSCSDGSEKHPLS